MPYAVIVKKKRKIEDTVKNKKLQQKLCRKLHDDEIEYIDYESVKYISMVGFRSSRNCDVRTTIFKNEAIFYVKEDFPYIDRVMGKKPYTIIDVNTGEELNKLPAQIVVAKEPETVGDVKDINTLKIN